MDDPKLEARLKLALAGGLGPTLTQRLLDGFGDPVRAAAASVRELQSIEGIGVQRARKIHESLHAADVNREWELLQEHGATLVSIDDEEYPLLLKHISDPPPLLYVRGRIDRRDSVCLAVVGSRNCTAYGREQADRLSAACVQAGLTIASGGARGIDTAAHRAALRLGGRTIAVLGCGLGECYPPENYELFDQIARSGAVVSELPMTAPPLAENFPRRNRIISGLSLGVMVVEAAVRSGALITARLAAEDHNREVLAVPGRIDSQASGGCHKMIREGWAMLVTNAAEILDSLGETGQALRAGMSSDAPAEDEPNLTLETAGMTDDQQALLAVIPAEPVEIDVLSRDTGQAVGTIYGQLTVFELRGLIERLPGNRVRRRG